MANPIIRNPIVQFPGSLTQVPATTPTNTYKNLQTLNQTKTSVNQTVVTTQANYQVQASDSLILADTSTMPLTITLPDATKVTGATYTIKNTGTGYLTVNTLKSQVIDGSDLTAIFRHRNTSVDFRSNGTSWDRT